MTAGNQDPGTAGTGGGLVMIGISAAAGKEWNMEE